MKKIILILLVGIFMSLSASAFASFNGTKKEAIVSIEKALKDPEINSWVSKKFGSQGLFLKAVSLAPEKTVKEIASTFNDFQENGGDIETAWEAYIWVYVLLTLVLIVAVASA